MGVNIVINLHLKYKIVLLKNSPLILFAVLLIGTIFLFNASAQEAAMPDWIKNNAGWWADGLIDDNSFISGIQWLISNGIIMLELEINNQDEEGRIAGGILTGESCNTEIDKDGDKVPDDLDPEGLIDWSHCTLEGRDLSNRDLSGANLSGANLYGAKLDNTNLSGADLSYTVLYKANLANTVFTGANLSYTNMCGATNPVVKGTPGHEWPGGTYHEPKYLIFDFTDTDMSYADFDHSQIQYAVLTDAIVHHTNFHDANLEGVDLSYKDLTGTILTEANLTNANLAGVDLSGKDLTGTILKGADLTDVKLPNIILSEMDFQKITFDGIDLSGKDLSKSSLWLASFKNTNLENVNLRLADLRATDLTKIKNKSLDGADLSGTSFLLANLSGINLSNVKIDTTNFLRTDLSGVDFTVIDGVVLGSAFKYSTMTNSNFEGVMLSPQHMYKTTFENKAYLKQEFESGSISSQNYQFELFGYTIQTRHIYSAEVRGNDLIIEYMFYNNFANAHLENANFKNASLQLSNFYSANLTNADLSGADLTKSLLKNADLINANLSGAHLVHADLSGADLSGAVLSGVVIDDNTILNCKNHPVCVN